MNAMAKEKYIPIDIYKRCIYVFIGTLDEFKAWVNGYFDDESEKEFCEVVSRYKDDKSMASFHYDGNNGQGVILIPAFPKSPKEYAALVHELLHATFFILNYCNVEYAYDGNNEAYTYLLEHLTRNALEKEGYKEVSNNQ